MYDTITELTSQLALKQMIIQHFIPQEEVKKTERMAVWSDELNDWQLKKYGDPQAQAKKRPQSAVGLKRPTSEYTRIAKGLGDINPRFKADNILNLDLDMPERTTEDYEEVPSARVQNAITAIL